MFLLRRVQDRLKARQGKGRKLLLRRGLPQAVCQKVRISFSGLTGVEWRKMGWGMVGSKGLFGGGVDLATQPRPKER